MSDPADGDSSSTERSVGRLLGCLFLGLLVVLVLGLGAVAVQAVRKRTGPPVVAAGGRGPLQSVVETREGVFVWAGSDGTMHMMLPAFRHAFDLQPFRSGSRLLIGSSGKKVLVANDDGVLLSGTGMGPTQGVSQAHKGALKDVRAVALSKDESLGLAGDASGTIEVWDLAKSRLRCTLRGHAGAIRALAVSDDMTALSAGDDGTIRLWDLSLEGSCLETISGKDGDATCVLFVPRSDGMLSVGPSGARIWGKTGERARIAETGLLCAAASEDGKLVALGGTRKLLVLKADSLAIVQTIRTGDETATAVAFSADGTACLAGTESGQVLGERLVLPRAP